MSKKRYFAMILALLLIVTLIAGFLMACDPTDPEPTPEPPAPPVIIDPPEPEPPTNTTIRQSFEMIGDKILDGYALNENEAFKFDIKLNADITAEGKDTNSYEMNIRGNLDYRNDANSVFYLRLVDTKVAEGQDGEVFGLYYENANLFLKFIRRGGSIIL